MFLFNCRVCNLIWGLKLLLHCLRVDLGIIHCETDSVEIQIHLIRVQTLHLPARAAADRHWAAFNFESEHLFGNTLRVLCIYIGTWLKLHKISQVRERSQHQPLQMSLQVWYTKRQLPLSQNFTWRLTLIVDCFDSCMGNNWDTSAERIKSVNNVVARIKAHAKE